jgi:mutual gliding-motility protein MglA
VSYVNVAAREIYLKLVYYGPGLSGKTANLEHIYARAPAHGKGKLVSLKTSSERTLFFDFLPLDVGAVGAFRARLALYTVPGQVFYRASRRLVLKGVDGVVFVVDSQRARLDANLEAMEDLRENLAEMGTPLDGLPLIVQYNKRDMVDIEPVEQLRELLNPAAVAEFESDARSGRGVMETLASAARLVLREQRRRSR